MSCARSNRQKVCRAISRCQRTLHRRDRSDDHPRGIDCRVEVGAGLRLIGGADPRHSSAGRLGGSRLLQRPWEQRKSRGAYVVEHRSGRGRTGNGGGSRERLRLLRGRRVRIPRVPRVQPRVVLGASSIRQNRATTWSWCESRASSIRTLLRWSNAPSTDRRSGSCRSRAGSISPTMRCSAPGTMSSRSSRCQGPSSSSVSRRTMYGARASGHKVA